MWEHGNYKQITHREAYDHWLENDSELVTVDSVVYRNGPGIGREVWHIVAPHDFFMMDEPIAYSVELVRPMWLYGSEGQLFPLKFLGRLSDEWLDVCDEEWFPNEENGNIDPFPDGSFLWELPNGSSGKDPQWKPVDWNWYEALRTGDVQ